tara:strand:- start:9283 stop:9804 length:522 start_codon:yes stop_codon:yes gene_type:complete
MKYIIIAITLITTLNLSAQDNFVLTEGKVTWQKVYETKKSKEELISYFKSSGLFKLFRVEDEQVIATLRPQVIDKDDKKIAGTLPPALTVKANYAGTVIIGLKDYKYRVTYKDILIVGNGELIKKGEKQPFEQHYVNKDGKAFRISFNKKPKTIYNAAFNQTFEMKTAKKDNW